MANKRRYRRCTKADSRFGPVCACGGPKAKQAFTCQACHSALRGYGTVPLAEQRRRWRRKYLGLVGSVGDEDAGSVRRAVELESAAAAAEGELALLIVEQARDSRNFRIGSRQVMSLDDVDVFGRPNYERIVAA